MALKIQTTGLEHYAAGGEGRLQVMIIGGPGAGKTRFSSYWPKPIYANCEAGLASIADRKMPFVNIKKSQDMLDLLTFLAQECRRPYRDRQFQTVVVDTLDAFQRAVKDEWLQLNPGAQSFRGFDAWGFLDAKMQMLLTRLLNLDMNVVVLAHYKDKTIKEGTGENATERQELMLQLSGEVKDSVFNDFDLVGWMGTYWDLDKESGQRVEKRGLTFKRTPDKPFLKDRLNVTPPWMEVQFSDDDYGNLFAAVTARLDDFEASEEIGEIPDADGASPVPGGVVGPQSGGALPPQAPKDIPLEQFDKPTLLKMVRDRGITTTADGQPIKGNTIKAELVETLRHHEQLAKKVVEPGTPSGSDAPGASPDVEKLKNFIDAGKAEVAAKSDTTSAATTPVEAAATPAEPNQSDNGNAQAPAVALEDLAAAAATTPVTSATVDTEVGKVDRATGEMTEQQVAEALGGQVVSVTDETDNSSVASPSPAPAPAAAAEQPAIPDCAVCGKNTAGENQDYVKLSYIKFRAHLCNAHYLRGKELRITAQGEAAVAALKAAA